MIGIRRGIIVAAALAAALAAVCAWRFASSSLAGGAEPFNPLRGMFATVSNTDRDLVDLEIVGSTSRIPNAHQIEPGRVLRFRLEKAYVIALLTEREAGYEIVEFSVDRNTGLPESFFQAVATKGPGSRDIPGVPVLSLSQQIERTMLIELRSDWPTTALERVSRKIIPCHGRQLESGLFENNPTNGDACHLPSYPPQSRYIAPYTHDLSLIITCHDYPLPTIDCEVQFPFHGFAVSLTFNHHQLSEWRVVVEQAIDFLNSKEYR
ncbi:MAG: hypothetical protein JO220_15640 [Hyphomicrobiales bacterium]|nr:hypothetical protein [Hyphomicrobiales bacterium]